MHNVWPFCNIMHERVKLILKLNLSSFDYVRWITKPISYGYNCQGDLNLFEGCFEEQKNKLDIQSWDWR